MKTDIIWRNIIKNEGEIFYTKRGISYTFIIENDSLIVNGDKKRRISREYIERALKITNPTPKRIQEEGIWGPSYVYGIITDGRIKKSNS